MSGTADQQIEMPCLGRPFQLGTLYDFRNDSLIPGVTLWGPETLGTATCTKMEGSDFEVITEDSLNEKALHLDVSAGLKLSVLGGLVKAGGSGKFLYDRTTSKNQARVSLKYRATSRFEQLNMSHLGKFEYPRVFDDDIATHVVTGVLYGADAIFVFDRQVESIETLKQVHGNLEAMISALPGIDLKVGGSADLDIQKKGKKGVEEIHCKFYGDFILPKNPTTYQDAVRVYQELPKLLGGVGYPKSVAKKVWLYPLSRLDSKVQRLVREISSWLVDDFQELSESLHDLEIRTNDLIRNEVYNYFHESKGDLKKLKRLIGSYRSTLLKRLSTLLPQVRGGGADETKLAELLEANGISPFSYERLSSWISGKEMEVSTLTVYLEELKKHQIQFAFSPAEMVGVTSKFDEEKILCFDFNIPAGNDIYLQRMEAYLRGQTVSQGLTVQTVWYKTHGMRPVFQRFVNFVKTNTGRGGVKYVVTNDTTESGGKLGALFMFIDACLTVFEPPNQPAEPQALRVTHNSIHVKWDKPNYGATSVQSYTVAYRTSDDPPDQWCTQASDEESLELTNLTPGSLYYLKVTAETCLGSSPTSEMSEAIQLPPDQPGKPCASIKNYNCVQLKWSKPKHGADIVQYYTVSYSSVNSLQDQWYTQICSDEYAVLTKLIPGPLYHFRVAANSPAGSSPASEVSEVMLPPDTPGKPVASDATYNSVHLKWTKPKNGAETVQSYSISCQAVDNQCYNMSTISNHECVTVTNLTPKTVYTFKVRAVSAAGHGPESELSDPVETTLPPPGKPHASNVTHNSLQLNWEKPSHGADSVQFYTVSYHAENEWNVQRTPVAVESMQLINLVPNAVYYFKVRAESDGEASPDSELSDPIITLAFISQPGKPFATKVTHDSITLKWERPKQGAQTLKQYTIYCNAYWYDIISHKTKAEEITLSKLDPRTAYTFQVEAETDAGSTSKSEISDQIETLLPIPGKPYASNITYEGFQVNWQKPTYGDILCYSISYQSTCDPINSWCFKRTVENVGKFSFAAARNKLYVFKVATVTSAGIISCYSEVSDPIETKAETWGEKVYKIPTAIPNSDPPTYLLPTHCVMKKNSIVKLHVGANSHGKIKSGIHSGCLCHTRAAGVPHKVLMLVGATGAGKTTLITGMANYILGVQWNDDFSFKLQAESQASCITAYTFYKESGSPLPYTLTVINTPGFSDIETTGQIGDKQLVQQIKELFSIAGDEGIDVLHGIGFVTQTPVFTPTEQYVFYALLSMFGKDVADNIFLITTGADPLVLKNPNVQDMVFFMVNNSSLLATSNEICKMSTKCFEEFFRKFSYAQAQSLQLSRDVIQESETLETTIQGLQPQIRAGLSMIDEIQQERQMVNECEADILTKKDCTYRFADIKLRMVDLPSGTYTTNCLTCNYTCHANCPYSNDIDKYKCTAMAAGRGTRSATCGVCPGKCSWMMHRNSPYQFELYQDNNDIRTSDQLRNKYESAMSSKEQLECVIKEMKNELDTLNMAVLRKMEQVCRRIQRLQEIALKPNYLTVVEYIDLLIETEEREHKHRWLERVKVLNGAHQLAKAELMKNRRAQWQNVFSVEETAQEKIIWQKFLYKNGMN